MEKEKLPVVNLASVSKTDTEERLEIQKNGVKVGSVRIIKDDPETNTGRVNFAVNTEAQGQNISTAAIVSLKQLVPSVYEKLVFYVEASNVASQRALKSAGIFEVSRIGDVYYEYPAPSDTKKSTA